MALDVTGDAHVPYGFSIIVSDAVVASEDLERVTSLRGKVRLEGRNPRQTDDAKMERPRSDAF